MRDQDDNDVETESEYEIAIPVDNIPETRSLEDDRIRKPEGEEKHKRVDNHKVDVLEPREL